MTSGDLERARGHFDRAIAIVRAAGARVELAWVCYEAAQTRIAQRSPEREETRALLNEADAIAAELGIEHLRKRIAEERTRIQKGPPERSYPNGLTEREVEILTLLSDGLTNREIGETLFISVKTVATHLRHAYEKTGVANRAEATAFAIRHGLVGRS